MAPILHDLYVANIPIFPIKLGSAFGFGAAWATKSTVLERKVLAQERDGAEVREAEGVKGVYRCCCVIDGAGPMSHCQNSMDSDSIGLLGEITEGGSLRCLTIGVIGLPVGGGNSVRLVYNGEVPVVTIAD